MPFTEAEMNTMRETLKFDDGTREPKPEIELRIADRLPTNVTAEQNEVFGHALLKAGYSRADVESKLGIKIDLPETPDQLNARMKQEFVPQSSRENELRRLLVEKIPEPISAAAKEADARAFAAQNRNSMARVARSMKAR